MSVSSWGAGATPWGGASVPVVGTITASQISDGTTAGRGLLTAATTLAQLQALGLGTVPFSAPVVGLPTASAHIFDFVPNFACAVDLNAGTWSVTGHTNLVNATASTTYVVAKNGLNMGSIVIGAGGNTATISSAGSFVLNGTTDRLSIIAPASPDATHANFTIHGRLTRT